MLFKKKRCALKYAVIPDSQREINFSSTREINVFVENWICFNIKKKVIEMNKKL